MEGEYLDFFCILWGRLLNVNNFQMFIIWFLGKSFSIFIEWDNILLEKWV